MRQGHCQFVSFLNLQKSLSFSHSCFTSLSSIVRSVGWAFWVILFFHRLTESLSPSTSLAEPLLFIKTCTRSDASSVSPVFNESPIPTVGWDLMFIPIPSQDPCTASQTRGTISRLCGKEAPVFLTKAGKPMGKELHSFQGQVLTTPC